MQFSFRSKITLLATALAVLPVGAVAYGVLDANADVLRVQARELQLAVVDDIARTLNQTLISAEDSLEAVGRVLLSTGDEDLALDAAKQLVASDSSLDHVAIYSREGAFMDAIRQASSKALTLPERLDTQLMRRAAQTGVAVGDVSLDPDAAIARIGLALPLSVNNAVTAYAYCLVRLHGLQQRVERLHELRFGRRPGSLFVVDSGARIVAHPRAKTALGTRVADHPALQGMGRVLRRGGIQQTSEYDDQHGEGWLGTLATVGDRGLAVVAQVRREDAYRALTEMRQWILAVTAAAMLLAALVAVFFSRRVTRPLERLTAHAGKLSQRDFGARVDVDSQDELGVLGDAMNQAATSLQTSEARLQEETEIRADLGRYLPAELVSQVIAREKDMHLGGRRQDITVMFADVVSFTTIARDLPAETVVEVLNELFTFVTGIVFRHQGMLDKFIGDCAMAIWGAPDPTDDHPKRAVAAAVDILRWLEVGNERWHARHGLRIEMAIGIHSGEAIIGNIGSESRMEYTAIGDVVNLAAHLESIARPQQILVSGATFARAMDGFEFDDLGNRKLPGRDEPVPLYAVKS